MYRTGYDLSDADIRDGYSRLGAGIDLPTRFYRHVASVITDGVQSGQQLLDIGCGNGRLLEQVALQRPDLELYGFDVAWASVRASRRAGAGRWRVVQASGLQLPFPSQAFDVVSMVEVLEHLKDPVAGLHEAARLVRRDGRIVITVPNLSAWNPFWRAAERVPVDVVRSMFLPSEHPLRTQQPIDTAYSYAELLELVHQAGLTVTAQHGRAYFPYVLSTLQLLAARSAPAHANGDAPASESPVMDVHTRVDGWLADVLPSHLAYRLTLECSPA